MAILLRITPVTAPDCTLTISLRLPVPRGRRTSAVAGTYPPGCRVSSNCVLDSPASWSAPQRDPALPTTTFGWPRCACRLSPESGGPVGVSRSPEPDSSCHGNVQPDPPPSNHASDGRSWRDPEDTRSKLEDWSNSVVPLLVSSGSSPGLRRRRLFCGSVAIAGMRDVASTMHSEDSGRGLTSTGSNSHPRTTRDCHHDLCGLSNGFQFSCAGYQLRPRAAARATPYSRVSCN